MHDLNVSDEEFIALNDTLPDTPLSDYQEMLEKVKKRVINYFFVKIMDSSGDIVCKMANEFKKIFHNEDEGHYFTILEDLMSLKKCEEIERFHNIILDAIQKSVTADPSAKKSFPASKKAD